MKETANDGIEFEILKEDQIVEKITRHSFRLPISGEGRLTARINNESFDVVNLSAYGMGIRLTKPNLFKLCDAVDGIELKLADATLRIDGKVVQISPLDAEDYICGIQFCRMPARDDEIIKHFVEERINKL